MQIESYTSGIYRVIRISDSFSVLSELEELRSLIIGYLGRGELYMAMSFSDTSYLYSGAISVLVSCYKMVIESGGDLCIIEPKKEMIELLKQMGLDVIIKFYQNEYDLPGEVRQIAYAQTRYRG